MKKGYFVLLLLAVIVIVTGLARVHIDTDVFSLLPKDSPVVKGLRLFQKSFGSSQTIIISITTPDENTTTKVAQTLAQKLRGSGIAKQVIWRSPFQNNPQALGEFLAYLWFNQQPSVFDTMARRFDDDQLALTLQSTIERMSTSLNPQEVARLAQDPFSLATIVNAITGSLVDTTKNPFASSDGRLRIFYVTYPGEHPDFWKYRDWLQSVNRLIKEWRQNDATVPQSTIRITGNPVFVTEFGTRLLSDVLSAALGTLLVIVLLFWWAHRRWAPLFWLVVLLMATVTVTVALSGFLFASLNTISLGFAAILVGLTVDYALILYQERRTHPTLTTKALRRSMAPSILWAAATTAGAFALVSRSSLPGLTQLGLLVATGILIAAVLMLLIYVALIGQYDLTINKSTTDKISKVKNNLGVKLISAKFVRLIENRIFIWSITLLLLLISVLMLLNRTPNIQYGVSALQFENLQARETLEEIQQKITGFGSELWLIVSGANEREVEARLNNAEMVLSRAKQQGIVTRAAMPTTLWPRTETQQNNRDKAHVLAQRLPAVKAAAQEAGFTPESLQLTITIFKAWRQFADSNEVVWPRQPVSRWLFSQFAANNGKEVEALGQLAVAPGTSKEQLQTLTGELVAADAGQLVGWSLLADSLVDTMKHDVTRVVFPIIVALVVMLGLAYRDVREIVLSFATLGFTLVCLTAVMGTVNWSWNLINMTAIPLLLGAGVDYSIHMQLALKRYAGDIARVRLAVGNAVLLCGASTAVAFASLGLASNPGLASLGRVAALGVVIACLTAVFLLPVWWFTMHRHKRFKEGRE